MSRALAKIHPLMRGPEADSQAEPIGVRLKRLRLEHGLSQRDLSSPGVSYAYISRIEAGARTPSVKALRMLARKLGVSVEYLETGREIGDAEQRELKLSDAELELRLTDDTHAVEAKLREVLEDARRAGDHVSAARALYALGFAAARRGNHLDAVEQLESALKQHHAPAHLRPDVYATLGQSYAALGAPDRAVRLFEDCLDEVRTAVPDDKPVEIRFATLLSYALGDAGDPARAAEVVQDALRTDEVRVGAHERIRLYWALARAANIDGRHLEALDYIRRAIGLLEATDDTVQLARGYLLSAGIEARERNASKMRGDLERAAELLGPDPEPRDLGMLRTGQSWLGAMEGDASEAVERARQALDVLGTHYGSEQGAAVWGLAGGLALAGDVTGADDAFRRAVDLLSVHGRRHDAARAAGEWSDMLRKAGRSEDAAKASERAAALGVDLEVEAARRR
jgi:tetratricopeptide (TPR) repeat protein